jgi:hypothetical protein
MSSNDTPRPTATLRKEVVPTSTWGEVVVRALKGSERLQLNEVPEVEGEQPAERKNRIGRLFSSRLLAVAVTDKTGLALYSADDWDIWLGTHGDELQPVFEKALALSGYDKLIRKGEELVSEEAQKNG